LPCPMSGDAAATPRGPAAASFVPVTSLPYRPLLIARTHHKQPWRPSQSGTAEASRQSPTGRAGRPPCGLPPQVGLFAGATQAAPLAARMAATLRPSRCVWLSKEPWPRLVSSPSPW
jgi:hypothetical protein